LGNRVRITSPSIKINLPYLGFKARRNPKKKENFLQATQVKNYLLLVAIALSQ